MNPQKKILPPPPLLLLQQTQAGIVPLFFILSCSGILQVAKDMGGMTKRVRDDETGLPVMDPHDFRRRFPDGRMYSNPGLATPEHGRRLLDASVQDAVETLRKFLSGDDWAKEAAAMKKAPPRKQKSRWADSRGMGKGRWAPRGSRRVTRS